MGALLNIQDYHKLSFNDYVEQFLDKYKEKSSKTLNTYKNSLEMMARYIFNKELSELTKYDIEKLNHNVLEGYKKVLLQENNKNVTVDNRLSAIKSFIKFLCAKGAINYDISKLELVEKLKDDSDVTEMIPEKVFYDYIDFFEKNEKKGLEKKLACLMMLETGCRADEILNIAKSQLTNHGEYAILKSNGKNKGKGNKDYVERVAIELYEEVLNLNPDSDKVFSISYKALCGAFDRANKYFGNEEIKYTSHSIKHLAVTLEWEYTRDILAAKRKGKHSSLETTMRYLKQREGISVGAVSRKLYTNESNYKQASAEELVSVIDTLPEDIKQLINQKLQFK